MLGQDRRDYDTMRSPLGDMLISASGDALDGLWFINQKYFPAAQGWRHAPEHPVMRATRLQIDAYFAGELREFSVPLAPRGNEFQGQVWQALRTIAFGELRTYGDIAVQIGLPRAHARAVGNAVGRNPISIIVPCHRVIGQTGALTGYAGGLERKRGLLSLERQGISGERPGFELVGEADDS
ncbi:methylated-DNA--[protein]-cysteine S-methyltransferase [Pararobbsia alpina]|uniref:Methylated-DNA--protein-cysteine methyltransferase n=1 Tax=Pararobbsia alpina TaxID=621374 RepID=A0A6S7BP43_9BURK|nr:methylated-DNA--[protein]-cysteine S-methyltransferase [Pararobbsia alpina]CAB3791440.1 Methylated-DNA--protein-cysteine methyltransferase [Pararobbsia alpina]